MTGLKLLFWMPDSWNIQPGVYAVVAATATLAGVFRSSISLVQSLDLLSGNEHAYCVSLPHHIPMLVLLLAWDYQSINQSSWFNVLEANRGPRDNQSLLEH